MLNLAPKQIILLCFAQAELILETTMMKGPVEGLGTGAGAGIQATEISWQHAGLSDAVQLCTVCYSNARVLASVDNVFP
jgi:hypothetical protein